MRSIGRIAFDAIRLELLHPGKQRDPHEIRLLSLAARSTTSAPVIQLSPLTKRAQQLIERNLAKAWNITELAERLGTSTATLNRYWKQDHADSIHAWRTARRLEWAVELLDQSHLSAPAIAKKTGIGSYSMLSRLLNRHYNTSAADFTRKHSRSVRLLTSPH